MSCAYTSSQNGKVECIIHSINNVIPMLLIQASLPGLHAATYLLNCLPTKMIQAACPHLALFGSAPSYEHLRVFGYVCYPNTAAIAPLKLAPRSTLTLSPPRPTSSPLVPPHVFVGYSFDHKGYRCLDLSTNHLIISRHVIFYENSFPLAASPNLTDLDFLLESGSTVSTIRT
jgi:hypothetical protein